MYQTATQTEVLEALLDGWTLAEGKTTPGRVGVCWLKKERPRNGLTIRKVGNATVGSLKKKGAIIKESESIMDITYRITEKGKKQLKPRH